MRGTPTAPAERGEQPAEHAILALLALHDGTTHGYDLMRHFAPTEPLAEILHLSQSMLYQHLKELDRAGWLTFEVERRETRPPRQVCHLTDAGRSELDRWLREPVGHTREIRLEFLIKLYFARLLDPELAQTLLLDQRAVCDRWRDSLSTQLAELPGPPPPATDASDFRRLVLSLRLAQTTTALTWIDEALQDYRG